MKIVHISRSDMGGGAALAAHRLHTALRAQGDDSRMLVELRLVRDPFVHQMQPDRALRSRVRRALLMQRLARDHSRYLTHRPATAGLFTDDRAFFGREFAGIVPEDAIVNLHWIAGFVDIGDLFRALPRTQKYVWRLADMNPLTGGCHLDAGCGKYVDGCGACPQLASSQPHDLSWRSWGRKQVALSRLAEDQLEIVAISTQIAAQARASALLGRFPISVIPCGADLDVFRPMERALCRTVLGLDRDATVVGFVAQSLSNYAKGSDLLVEALTTLSEEREIVLLTMGLGDVPAGHNLRQVMLGNVQDERFASLAYNCMDLVVVPSRQETFGQVVLEALGCGVPVVGFNIGGIRDVVRSGHNGFVATEVSAVALRAALEEALSDRRGLSEMSVACRESVSAGHSTRAVAERYRELYGRMRC